MKGGTRIKRFIRNTRRLVSPVAVILIYHRIIDLAVDPHHLAVSPAQFARHLETIREKYVPLSLGGLVDAMQGHDMPQRSVVITFDDGYADNFRLAAPLLEAYQVPATIFIVSGAVNSKREFWWDDLERILLSQVSLPAQLTLSIHGEELAWPITSSEQRWRALRSIQKRMRRLHSADREKILADLAGWAGVSLSGRPEHLPMQLSELCQTARSKYIEIGAHTKTHPVLSALDPEEQRAEMLESRLALETDLEKPVRTFSYPYGNREDFSQHTVEIVKDAGFAAAVTTIQGGVEPGDDLFQLKRCEVNNWDAETFQGKLASFFYT